MSAGGEALWERRSSLWSQKRPMKAKGLLVRLGRAKSSLRHPCFRKPVRWGPPSMQAAPGVPSRVRGVSCTFSSSPHLAAVPRFLGLGLHLDRQPPAPHLGLLTACWNFPELLHRMALPQVRSLMTQFHRFWGELPLGLCRDGAGEGCGAWASPSFRRARPPTCSVPVPLRPGRVVTPVP